MVKRRVIWSDNAKIELKETLDFYKRRNKSADYSRKLFKRFKLELEIVAKRPFIGIKTNRENTRGLIIADYIIFYEPNMFANRIQTTKIIANMEHHPTYLFNY